MNKMTVQLSNLMSPLLAPTIAGVRLPKTLTLTLAGVDSKLMMNGVGLLLNKW